MENMKIKIKLMSPERMLELSSGRILNQRTLNFKFNPPRPEQDGLLCERIFGPINDYECKCRSLVSKRHAGKVCEKCQVEVTNSYVRCQRLGHIELPIPIMRPLIENGILKMFPFLKFSNIKLLYEYSSGLLFEEDDKGLYILADGRKGSFKYVPLMDNQFMAFRNTAYTLPETILKLNIEETSEINPNIKKLLENEIDPRNYVLIRILVSPAGHRPVMKTNDFWVIHCHNQLYGRIIRRCNRIETLQHEALTPRIIFLNEQRLLQKAVNELFVQGTKDSKGRDVSSLVDNISGKDGRFRLNLLGKRIDYSGRTMIVSDPSLKLNEARIPRKMVYELFKPFIIYELKKKLKREKVQYAYKEAKKLYRDKDPMVWDLMEDIIDGKKIVMLNRHPTLHRYGLQAFWVKLSDYHAIGLHPCVCAPFNADFDGDQMAVHVPLSRRAFNEAKNLMLPRYNLLGSRDSQPIIKPSHEMIIGAYIMTNIREEDYRELLRSDIRRSCRIIADRTELDYLLQTGHLQINEAIWYGGENIPYNNNLTCAGRILMGELLDTKITEPLTKKAVSKIMSDYYDNHSLEEMEKMLDEFKDLTFHYATLSGLSLSMDDIRPPKNRDKRFKEVEEFCEKDTSKTNENKLRKWYTTIQELGKEVVEELGSTNPVIIMLKTGARASFSQVSQLTVAKGLIANAKGEILPNPVTHSLMDGLTLYEFFDTIAGARKSLADKKLLTPKSGYLERRLVTIARDLYVDGEDCKTIRGIRIKEKYALGKYTVDGRLINKIENPERLVTVRSPITCEMKSKGGVCRRCFGTDPSTRKLTKNKIPVGVIASQSLIEPTTQLSLRQFHHSGVASIKSSPLAIISSIGGRVKLKDIDENIISITVFGESENRHYMVMTKHGKILVKEGQEIEEGSVVALYEQDLGNEDVNNTIAFLIYYFEVPDRNERKCHIPATVVAQRSGKVFLRKKDDAEVSTIEIFIDGYKQGEVTDSPIYYGTGDYAEEGDFLTYGEADLNKLYKETDLEFTGRIFVSRLLDIYGEEGITVYPCHLELIFRAMTEIVIDTHGRYNLRRFISDDEIEKICLFGSIKNGKNYPSWFKKASFGWVKDSLRVLALEPQLSLDLPSERIMIGGLLPYAKKLA